VNAMTSEIELLQSQIADVNRSLRLIEERKDQYVEKTKIPLDLIRNEELQKERLNELTRRLEALLSTTTLDQDTSRHSIEAKIKEIYVDRDEERKLFRDMISGQTAIHILLIEAKEGMGKTSLLDQFWEASKGFKHARVDFKHSSYSMGAILGEMCDQYGRQSFPIFYTECRNLLSHLGHVVADDALICAAIDLKLAKISGEELKNHQRLITNAFLVALEAIREKDQPVVMLFDGFERASTATKNWIAERLIHEIRRYPRLVCVITGVETPRITIDDTNWSLQHKLQPLSDQHSREYIQKVIYIQDESIVTFITSTAEGHPYTLQQHVLNYVTKYLPRIGGGP